MESREWKLHINNNLSKLQSEIAPKIYECLLGVKKMSKQNSYREVFEWVNSFFIKLQEFKLEYFKIANPKTLMEIPPKDKPLGNRAFIAVKLGNTRLIDNLDLS